MDAGRPKRKRSELELLLGNGDVGGLSTFSPRLPALSVSSPVLAEASAESDEQLARRLHEELNGTRMTRRGSKAVTEDGTSLSPAPARGVNSPHVKTKAETPRAHGGAGRISLPLLPSISESAPGSVDGGVSTVAEGRTVEGVSGVVGAIGARGGSAINTGAGPGIGAGSNSGTGPGTGSGSASALGPGADGSNEAVKRKRNSVPARELHLLLQQASSTAGRAEATLSPTRSARGNALASARTDLSAPGNELHHHSFSHQQGSQLLPRRDADRTAGQQHQATGSAASAPLAPPPSPGALRPPSPRVPQLPPPSPRGSQPPPPSLLPPKLKQRYLAMSRPPGSMSASEGGGGRTGDETVTIAATTAVATATTAVTPSCVQSGARNSLLSGHSLEGTSVLSQSQSQSPSRGRDGFSAVATYTPSESAGVRGVGSSGDAVASAASLAATGPRSVGATGTSIGGCSSTDETENDNDNSCAAALAGTGDGGPSATSPKASLVGPLKVPPPLPPPLSMLPCGGALQKQHSNSVQASGQRTESDVGDEDPHLETHGRTQRQSALAATAPTGTVAQVPSSGPGKQAQGQAQAQAQSISLAGPLKVPKLPMIRAGRGWYRGRLMRESVDGQRVLVDVPGAPNQGGSNNSTGHTQNQPFWLPVTSDRIWRGSYKGKDWKYLGDGAWEPKTAAFKRGKQGSSSNGLPLPLPSWAVDGTGGSNVDTDADAQALPAASVGGIVTATGQQRSKSDRGSWSSPDEMSDDGQEVAEEPQQVTAEGPSTRSGQRGGKRRSSPAATSGFAGVGSGKVTPASAAGTTGPGDGRRRASATAGVYGGAAASTAGATATEAAVTAGAGDFSVEPEDVIAGAAAYCVETEQLIKADALDGEVKAVAAGATAGVAEETVVTEAATAPGNVAAPAAAATAVATQAGNAPIGSPEGASASASADNGAGAADMTAAATTSGEAVAATKVERRQTGGDGTGAQDDCGDGDIITWVPGAAYPRKHVPRRGQRRQQRLRTPFDGIMLQQAHPQTQHNPYAFFSVLSDESGDVSDAEHCGGRRVSGDGTAAAAHHGSRRRAAARAAAVAAAAARAEAEAEEEEQEEILLGRRPPRRDRFHLLHGGGGAPISRRNHHNIHHHHRSRSAARADYYLYGDSSGNLDDPYSGDGTVHVHGSSARPRASSRGNSQPAPEYASGGSGAWESMPWQAAGINQMDGAAGPMPSSVAAPPRNRRKGKPSRSRMDGEGDAWCCGEDEWELEARGGAWARMPEVLRRLYYAPCPVAAADPNDGAGGGDGGANAQQLKQQQRPHQDAEAGRIFSQHRQSGGGAYFGALQAPNKRRRAYEEDATVSPDDLDLEMEIDDHEHDADYLPPYGIAGGGGGSSRRSSGFSGGGRRCSANGGSVGATKRQRSAEVSYLHVHHQQYQLHPPGLYTDAMVQMTVQPKRRILVTCGPQSRVSGTLGGMASVMTGGIGGFAVASGVPGCSGDGGIPAGLAGLLEAALGQDTTSTAAAATVQGALDGGDPNTQSMLDLKVEPEAGLDNAEAAAAVAADTLAGAASDVVMSGGLPLQGMQLAVMAPGDPHGAHVALSDSSAAPSGMEEGKYGNGSGGGTLPCADGSGAVAAAFLYQRLSNSSGGGAGASFVIEGGSPPPSGVQLSQLRPNTPTRAKRTGRPPFAGLGAGAPVPKLPALSSTVSHRMQVVGMAGMAGVAAAAATVVDNGPSGNISNTATITTSAAAAADISHLPTTDAMDMDALRGFGEPQAQTQPIESLRAQPVCPTSALPASDEHFEEEKQGGGRGGDNGGGRCRLWQEVLGADGGSSGAAAAARAGSHVGVTISIGRGVTVFHGSPCPVLIGTTATPADLGADGGVPVAARKQCGIGSNGNGCCLMEAVGALKYDKQPAMQQLAMRAQLEVDSIGLMMAAQQQQQHHHYHNHQQHGSIQLQDEPLSHYILQQRLLSGRSGGGGGSGGGNSRGSGLVRSGSVSAAASPPAPDPLISSLPSVEVVVSLFSARTHHGSAQQALSDLVGGSTALPLFQ